MIIRPLSDRRQQDKLKRRKGFQWNHSVAKSKQTIYLDKQLNHRYVIQLLWLLLVQVLFAVVVQLFWHLARFLSVGKIKRRLVSLDGEFGWRIWLVNSAINQVRFSDWRWVGECRRRYKRMEVVDSTNRAIRIVSNYVEWAERTK